MSVEVNGHQVWFQRIFGRASGYRINLHYQGAWHTIGEVSKSRVSTGSTGTTWQAKSNFNDFYTERHCYDRNAATASLIAEFLRWAATTKVTGSTTPQGSVKCQTKKG